MISLHGGRLQLVCNRADRNWHVVVVLGPKPEHKLEASTNTRQLQEALICAKTFYAAAVHHIRPSDGRRMCWDCLQWNVRTSQCELGLPESKRSGGRFAAVCDLYESAHSA